LASWRFRSSRADVPDRHSPKEGFTIEKGLAGIPTAWTARWGFGKPVIALGSDAQGRMKVMT
jgi:hypothetical protein